MTDLVHAPAAQPPPSLVGRLPAGLADVVRAFQRHRLWIDLAWANFHSKMNRAHLGAFWEPIKTMVWVVALSQVFRAVLNETTENYIAYVAAGIVMWNYITVMSSGSTKLFTRSREMMLNINLPVFTHVLGHVAKGFIRLLYQAPVYLLVLPFCSVKFGWVTLWFIPGFLLVQLTGLWVAPLMGMLGARYPDYPFAVASVMRFLFYTTPVFWVAEGLGQRAYLATFNPLTHFLAIVREPLLGHAPQPLSWLVVGSITSVGLVITVLIYHRYHRRIIFWL